MPPNERDLGFLCTSRISFLALTTTTLAEGRGIGIERTLDVRVVDMGEFKRCLASTTTGRRLALEIKK